jgi:hypothetical protein
MADKRLQCQFCGETFDSKEEMKKHAMRHHPEKMKGK